MTVPVRSTIEILTTTPVAAGSTEAAPGLVGPWVSVAAVNGGQLVASVTNGASAPGVQGQYIWQGSDRNDGVNISEIWRGGGNVIANGSPPQPPINLPREFSYVRLVCFGHTTNPVSFRGVLLAKG